MEQEDSIMDLSGGLAPAFCKVSTVSGGYKCDSRQDTKDVA
jgi:hypothetical protein